MFQGPNWKAWGTQPLMLHDKLLNSAQASRDRGWSAFPTAILMLHMPDPCVYMTHPWYSLTLTGSLALCKEAKATGSCGLASQPHMEVGETTPHEPSLEHFLPHPDTRVQRGELDALQDINQLLL